MNIARALVHVVFKDLRRLPIHRRIAAFGLCPSCKALEEHTLASVLQSSLVFKLLHPQHSGCGEKRSVTCEILAVGAQVVFQSTGGCAPLDPSCMAVQVSLA